MTSPFLLLAGRFLLASALLMALYWVVWRKQATYRAKRMYLLTMPIVALAISLLQVEVYKPEPVVVEVASPPTLAHEEKGVDYPVQIFPPLEKNISLTENKSEAGNTLTNQAETSVESNLSSSPLQEEKKGWFTTLSLDSLLGIAYVLIVLLLCIPFVVNLIQLRRLRCKVSIINHEANNICILMGKAVEAPFSFHRSIFMPLSLTEAQRRMILTHERAHILHRHYLDVWVAEAVTRLLWWNPFLWWARAELRNVHEFEADSNVLATGEDVYAYQSILIEEVLHGDVVIANGFNHSFIRRRFIEMLQSSNRRMSTLGKASSTAWMLLMAALMCCTMGEAEVIYKEMKLTTEEDDGKWHVAESKELSEYLPDMASQLSNESAVSLIRALGTLNSIKELSPEEYEELKKAYPAETIPSLESINKSVREIKKSLEGQMSESMTDAFIGLNKSLLEQMREKGLDTLGSSKEDEDKVYHFTEKGNLSFTDTNGNEHEYTIKDDEITEEEIEFLINGTSQLTKNAMEVQGAMANALGGIFKSLFSSLSGSISPMTQETYDSLKRLLPADEEVASLEEINKGLEFLRDSLQMMTNAFSFKLGEGEEIEVPVINEETIITSDTAGLGRIPKEIGQLLDIQKTIAESAIDTSLEEQDRALDTFFDYWFRLSEDSHLILEDEYKAMLKDAPTNTTYPTFEEYVENRGKKMDFDSQKMKEALARMNSEIQPQVKAWLKLYGYALPREKRFEMVVEHKGRTWKTWKFTKEPFSSSLRTETNESPHKADPNAKHVKAGEVWKEIIKCVHSLSSYHKYLSATVTTEEYEVAKKRQPDLPDRNDLVRNRELSWTVKELYIESILERLDENVANQVREAIKRCNTKDFPEKRIIFAIDLGEYECLFKKEVREVDFESTLTTKRTPTPLIVTEEKTSDEDFISPQWGLELPEGYIRLTDYKKLTETDATAKAQYNQLMSCFRNAQALRKEALKNAYKEKHPRYVSVEEAIMPGIKKLFRNADIELMEKGAYRLPDGTIVIEDDRLNLMPQSVNYHHGTTYRGTLLRNQAPTMERDKSPNYDAHNEQTWPVYTNVQKVSYEEYMKYSDEPQVFRGEDCTYVVYYTRISYDFHWFHPTSRGVLVNRKTGDQYMIRYREHFPLDTYLWIHGQQGEYIRMVDVFPPLPKDVTTVDYIPGKIPAEIKLSNASPYKQYEKLKVQSMEQAVEIVY